MKTGSLVKRWRKDNGLSLRAAADRIGVAHTTIQGLELGRTPTPDVARRLAKEMGISMEALYGMAVAK